MPFTKGICEINRYLSVVLIALELSFLTFPALQTSGEGEEMILREWLTQMEYTCMRLPAARTSEDACVSLLAISVALFQTPHGPQVGHGSQVRDHCYIASLCYILTSY